MYYEKFVIYGCCYFQHGFRLSHAPIHPCALGEYDNIHGHIHRFAIPDNRYINVSCDVINYAPINLDQINVLRKK